MSYLVPFDDSPLSRTALRRAGEFGRVMDERVVALVVVPPSTDYAREKGWIDPGEPYDADRIERGLRAAAREIAPDAEVRVETTEETDYRASMTTDVVRRIRQVAGDLEASVLFIGTANAGSVVTPVASVGSPVSDDPQYDVHLVRHADEDLAD
ncbi:universal stress protein UspA-like protein [Salinarchaeum sp. Harcht-Bsk1]|uniref:universal stress protein n=1 Tax=Salinarchaeum sp. Harcht-Bsk1 TaxID=1333523 RepID=UPI00034232CF|nr:universal stress protein [Salinarchaeum sp. Harcht-Bsk1]AGN01745.1 universal stress protein UspA-like protein [Salinarchaeum sp. Harcht-Bsk1]